MSNYLVLFLSVSDAMGRIKTTFVKSIGRELYEKHKDKFFSDFSKNKPVVDELIFIKSKKLRNIIAGYLANLKKQEMHKISGY